MDSREVARRRIAHLFKLPIAEIRSDQEFARDFPVYPRSAFSTNPYDHLLEDIQDMRSPAQLVKLPEIQTVKHFEDCVADFARTSPEKFQKKALEWRRQQELRCKPGWRGLIWRVFGL